MTRTGRRDWARGGMPMGAERIPAFVGIAIAFSATSGQAQETLSRTPVSDVSSGWIATTSVTGMLSPKYEGASKYGLSGLPALSFRRPNEPDDFSAPDDGLDYTLSSTSNWKFGPVINLRSGRSAHDDARLAGLDNYPWAIEAGVFAEFWPLQNRLRTRLEIRHGLHRHDGFVADFSTDLVQKFGAFTLSGGPRISLVDTRIMQQEFGVTPLASMRNGILPAYDAHGGIKSVGIGAALSYEWSDQWRTTVFHRYDHLIGDAGASPVTTRFGARNQSTFGLELSHSFRMESF